MVIADRFFYTAELLATAGRGLTEAEVAPVVAAAKRGVEPDLVVLVDVDPHVARARRKVSKVGKYDPRPPSRKGLAGVGLQFRLRDGYRARAAREPERWIVVDNTEAELQSVIDGLIAAVGARRAKDVAAARACLPAPIHRRPATTLPDAAAALGAWLDARATREPALAAYLVGGLTGPEWDPRRRALAAVAPQVIASDLRNLQDDTSWALRAELAPLAPGPIARSYLSATNPLALTPVDPARVPLAQARVLELLPQARREVAGGGFVVVWRSDSQDGSNSGIYQQLFGSAAELARSSASPVLEVATYALAPDGTREDREDRLLLHLAEQGGHRVHQRDDDREHRDRSRAEVAHHARRVPEGERPDDQREQRDRERDDRRLRCRDEHGAHGRLLRRRHGDQVHHDRPGARRGRARCGRAPATA